MINFSKLLKSFLYALHGLYDLWQTQQNFKIHIITALIIVGAAYGFGLSRIEFIILLLPIGIIIFSEIVNSNIERLLDIISPNTSHEVRIIKDMSAAAVLILSTTAIIIGLFLFLPHLWCVHRKNRV